MLWCCVWQEGRRYQGSFLLEFAYVTLGQLGLSSFVCFFFFPLLLDLFFLVPEINIREKVEIGEEKTIDPPNFKRRMPRKSCRKNPRNWKTLSRRNRTKLREKKFWNKNSENGGCGTFVKKRIRKKRCKSKKRPSKR